MNQNSNSLGIFTESIDRVACPSCNAELDVSEFQVFEEIECPSCQKKFQVPGRLGGFILIEELGRGAMGCVYLAMDESLQRLVALKVIRKEYGTDPKMLETVQREAQAMATLNHRNIAQVYSFGRVREQPYFVMELLQGERLDEMMEGGTKINEIRALEIALDVAKGLDAANEAGLTHGDIKPANILMNEKGVAKVVDFGLARFMEPGAEIEVWGTPYYIAPEKARKKGEDSRSDQYSLGGTIFHSLAGQPPFDGPNPTKVVVAALKEDTPNLLDFNETVTEKTAAVIRRMMEKNPNRRYPTYASLLADLEMALQDAKAAEQARVEEEQRLLEKQNKKINPLIPIAMVVTLVVLGVIGIVVMKQMSGSGPSVEYGGDKRELDQPFSTVELRNLNAAVNAVKAKKYGLAIQKLSIANKHIPEDHAAASWAKFLEAGIHFYAQHPEQAKKSLEAAASVEDLIFDAPKTPAEDPRILANYVLGNLDQKDLAKATRKAKPYYQHLSELAIGYRYLLEKENNQSARHFRAYGEYRVQGIDWPYVLQPLAAVLNVPLEKLEIEPVEDEAEQGEDMLTKLMTEDPVVPEQNNQNQDSGDSGENTSETFNPPAAEKALSPEGYPQFKTTFVKEDKEPNFGASNAPVWRMVQNIPVATIPNNHILTNATGVQILPGRAFTLSAKMLTPPAEEITPGEWLVLFHFGAFFPKSTVEPLTSAPPKGLVMELSANESGTALVRVRIGDGKKELYNQVFVKENLILGSREVFTVIWDGYLEQGTPIYQLILAQNARNHVVISLKDGPYPEHVFLGSVSIGRGLGKEFTVGWDTEDLMVSKIVIFAEAVYAEKLQKITTELFQ